MFHSDNIAHPASRPASHGQKHVGTRNGASTVWLWLAVGILLLAALLRIYNLNLQGLWGDEGWSVEFSEPGTPGAITRNLIDDLHPPLYFILLGGWRQVAGSSEVALRLLAVFPALLTVALLIRLGRRLFSPAAGLGAGLVLALADKHTLLAQEVRHYPLAFMWMAASSWAFFAWLTRPTRGRTLLYAGLVIASLYTHYYTGLIFAVQVVYALFFLRPWARVGRLVALLGLAGLAFAPWSLIAIHQIHIRPEGIRHSMPLAWRTASFLLTDLLGRPESLLLALLALGVIGWRRWRPVIRQAPAVWYGVVWLGLPIALTVAIYEQVSLLTDRNMALLLLPVALLAGQGLAAFRPRGQALLALLLIANGLTSLDSYADHPPWREMAHYVATNHPAGEPVVMDVRGGDKALRYHLARELPPDTPIVNFNQLRLDHGLAFHDVLQTFLAENAGFWVAYWGPPDYALEDFYQTFGYQRTASHAEYHLGNPIYWYHYDRVPPLDQRLGTFDETITLHQMKAPAAGRPGGAVPVSLWWSTRTPLDVSYSISVFVLDESGRLRAQHDGPPQSGAQPTTAWPPDEIIFDTHRIPLPDDLPPGDYRLAVKVYDSATGQVLQAVGQGQTPDVGGEYLVVGTVTVQ